MSYSHGSEVDNMKFRRKSTALSAPGSPSASGKVKGIMSKQNSKLGGIQEEHQLDTLKSVRATTQRNLQKHVPGIIGAGRTEPMIPPNRGSEL